MGIENKGLNAAGVLRPAAMALGLGWGLVACGQQGVEAPETYTFQSRFSEESSVSYTGQTMRQVLIADLKKDIGALTDNIDSGSFTPESGDVIARMNFYYDFDGSTAGTTEHGINTSPGTAQTTYNDIAEGKNLVGKVAGNDEVGQHKDWASAFVGWDDPDVSTPASLVEHWFEQLEQLAIDRANGTIPQTPGGDEISEVYITESGQDLQQLIQKFLLGAVAFSQGVDDYLDDDTDGKGLLSDNTESDEGAAYTSLEHQWDEGFGYFGAARNYLEYTDEELAGAGGREAFANGYHDADGDGAIDLTSEMNFDYAAYAADRDLGSAEGAKTDYTQDAFEAFVRGRAIIAEADGALDEDQLAELKAQRDIAVTAWEKVIAANVVHYLNATLQDMSTFDSSDYNFADHAKHWSEMKAFALSLQFNPRTPLTDAQLSTLQDKMGKAPALPDDANVDAYKTALLDARALLQDAYGFADANMGDANGTGGW